MSNTKAKAREILSSMAAMAKNERLEKGVYIMDDDLPTLKKAPLCNGYRACAIGSLYLSAGIRAKKYDALPGTNSTDKYVRRYGSPALKVAYAALNEAAERELARRVKNNEFWDYKAERKNSGYDSAVEFLFEESDIDNEGMVALIKRARRTIK